MVVEVFAATRFGSTMLANPSMDGVTLISYYMIDQNGQKELGEAYSPMRGIVHTGGGQLALGCDPDLFVDDVDNELTLLNRFVDLIRV